MSKLLDRVRVEGLMGVLRWAIAVLAAAVGLVPASASATTHDHKSPCATPHGWKVVARDAQAVIVKLNEHRVDSNGTLTTAQWRYCLRRRGGFHRLADDIAYYGGYGDIITVARVVLSGAYVAYDSVDYAGGGRYGCSGTLTIYDLLAGKATDAYDWDCSAQLQFTGPLLDPHGFAAWHLTTYPVATYTALKGVSCPSMSLCVASDAGGSLLTSTNPLGGRSAWTITKLPAGIQGAISCPTAQFCAATAGDAVLTSTDPTGGPSAWTVTSLFSGYHQFTGISCPSASLCVAVDAVGDVVVSTNPIGGPAAWRTTNIDGRTSINAVSCPSGSLCVAVDNLANVLTSTNPTGSASAWSAPARVDPDPHYPALNSISCPSASLCVATADDYSGGNLVISTNPTGGAEAWALIHVDDGKEPVTVSCASVSLCIAFDYVANVITSTNPAGRGGSWSVSQGPDPGPYYYGGGITASCPSVSLCVEVDAKGRIGSSSNPAAGGSTWSSALVDSPLCAITTPCAAEQVYAHDSSGTRVLDTAPPGTGTALTDLQLRGSTLTWLHDGIPNQATLR